MPQHAPFAHELLLDVRQSPRCAHAGREDWHIDAVA
jgi:hypothetical protein